MGEIMSGIREVRPEPNSVPLIERLRALSPSDAISLTAEEAQALLREMERGPMHGMKAAIHLARYQLRRGAEDLGAGEIDDLLRMVVACGEDPYIPLADEGSEAAKREGSPLQQAVLAAAQRLSWRRGQYWPTIAPGQQEVYLAEVMSVVASIDEERGGPGHHYGVGYAQGQADAALRSPAIKGERDALRDELTRLEAAAPLSAKETARYLEIERRLSALENGPASLADATPINPSPATRSEEG